MKRSLGHIGHVVKSFFDLHWDKKSPLLIGYSGGPDSKALLYAVIEWGRAPIHIAHVDHGWRVESGDEALILRKEAEQLGVTFHIRRLEKLTTENEARECRLDFFRFLQERFSFQAILLGHQADDLAETVLKRLFEGAHLPQLGGMKSISSIDGLLIWRPLLYISKNEIKKWLADRCLNSFDDSSNRDLHYLRARTRSELLPFLNKSFGKNISENLAVLSERACELEDYLSQRCSQFMSKLVKGPLGWWVDGQGLHRIELRRLIQHVAKQEDILFSRSILESILDSMFKLKANHEIFIQHRAIVVDRGHFFLLAKRMPQFNQPIFLSSNEETPPLRAGFFKKTSGEGFEFPLRSIHSQALRPGSSMSGRQRSGDWVIEEIPIEQGTALSVVQCHWQGTWKGEFLIQCFDGNPFLQLPSPGIRWSDKAPLFLRKICPVLMLKDRLIGDFVMGKVKTGQRCIKIFVDLH